MLEGDVGSAQGGQVATSWHMLIDKGARQGGTSQRAQPRSSRGAGRPGRARQVGNRAAGVLVGGGGDQEPVPACVTRGGT